MRSPLRYPGGKSRFLRVLLPKLQLDPFAAWTYGEPFVGGGSVALAIAEGNRSARLVLNDLDPDVATFWRVVVDGDINGLCERVASSVPTVPMFDVLRASTPTSDVEQAFRFLFLNRCSHSGLGKSPIGGRRLVDGHQPAKNYAKGKEPVACRWGGESLALHLEEIHYLLRGRTTVLNVDACEVPWQDMMYFDPPYVEKGPELYFEHGAGAGDLHERLAKHLANRSGWVLSYDDSPYVESLYASCVIEKHELTYSISSRRSERVSEARGRNRKGIELVITAPARNGAGVMTCVSHSDQLALNGGGICAIQQAPAHIM